MEEEEFELDTALFTTKRVIYGALDHQISIVARKKGGPHPRALMLYASGGGFYGGGTPFPPNLEDPLWSELILEHDFAVAGVGYGLSPEFKYPGSPDGDLKLLHAVAHRTPSLFGFHHKIPVIDTGKSAGATAALKVAVDAQTGKHQHADGLVLFLALSNFHAVNLPNNLLWTHFEPGSKKKADVPKATLDQAGAATFLETAGPDQAKLPPPLWLSYGSPLPMSTGPLYTYEHDAAHGQAFVDAMNEKFPGTWKEPLYRFTHTPGVIPTAQEIVDFLIGAGVID